MSDRERPTEPLDPEPGPAEARLDEVLQTLREERPEPSHALVVRVVAQARWQRGLRAAMSVVAQFAAAAGGVARVFLGRRA